MNVLFLALLSPPLNKLRYESMMGPALHLPIHLLLLYYSVQFSFAVATNPPNVTNDSEPDFVCKTADVWTRPTWPTNIWQHCSELLDNMVLSMPEVFEEHGQIHEFLPMGRRPSDPDLVPVRTPWKLVHGPCTLAVTILASIPPGWLPTELGPQPFDPNGYCAWFTVYDGAKAILDHCLTEQKAGMSWYLRDDPQIGIFLIATGSPLDRAIGPKVNSALDLPPRLHVTGSNLTSVGEATS